MSLSLRRALILMTGGLLLAAAPTGSSSYGIAPGALSILISGDLLILDSHRGLFLYSPDSRKVKPLVNGFGLFEAADLNIASLGGVESIFVTKTSRNEGIGSRLARYSLVGKLREEWNMPPWKGRFSGVVVDPQSSMSYVVSAKTGEIFKLDVGKSGAAFRPKAKIPDTVALGPIILDASRKRLLVADAGKGTLFGMDLESGRSEVLAKGLGEPSALALDAKTEQLFIADALGGRIWLFDLRSEEGKPRLFLEKLGEPMGLALTKDGGLWVGVLKPRTLLLVSREGKIIANLRL